MRNAALLVIENLSLHFGKTQVLRDVSFQLESGSIAGLLGASGCGKTTLLRCISGFQGGFQGRVLLKGEDLSKVSLHKRGLGFVFQDLSLFPHMNMEENIGFGLHRLSRSEKSQRIAELLEIFGLASLGLRFPHELSGGQKQRVALARSMAPRPNLILMDEPFSGLDSSLKRRLLGDLKNIVKEQGQAILMVTHSQEELFQLADEGGVLIQGTLHQWSKVGEIYNQPQTPEVALAVGQGSLVEIECGEGGGQTKFGWIPWNQPPAHTSHKFLTPRAGQKIFIRPEQVRVNGEVKETDFYIKSIQDYGSHQLVEVVSRLSSSTDWFRERGSQGTTENSDERTGERTAENSSESRTGEAATENSDKRLSESLWARAEKNQKLEIHQSVTVGWSGFDSPVLFYTDLV